MEFIEKLQVSIGFSSTSFYNSLGKGAPPTELPTIACVHIFINDLLNFREKFDKIL